MRPINHHGKARWVIEYGIVEGKRRRAMFDTESDARKELTRYRKDRRELGNAWTNIEPKRRFEVLQILREIKQYNTDLKAVWEYFKEHSGKKAGITVREAMRQFLDRKKTSGVRPLYLRELRYGLEKFADAFGPYDIADVDSDMIQLWLDGMDAAGSTKTTLQSRASGLFSWAIRKKYVKSNPIMRMETLRVTKKDPEILTVDQCRALSNAAKEMDEGIILYLALALFMGIRPEECKRLEPESFKLSRKVVIIKGSAAKTRNRRIVEMTEPAYRIIKNCTSID